MAEIAKKVGKALGYGTLGTILTAGITYGITQFADAFSAIPTDTPAMQIVKYATTVGAGVAFAGAAAYQASDGTKWYSITPRGGKGKVSREMQDILESSIGIGHKETLAELLSDLGENAVDNDVAYDVGIKKVEGHDLVYVKKFERGSVTGLTYTKEMSYQIFQLLDAKDVKPREQVDGGANGKAYIALSLKQIQAIEENDI
jgi:hypothetical protein